MSKADKLRGKLASIQKDREEFERQKKELEAEMDVGRNNMSKIKKGLKHNAILEEPIEIDPTAHGHSSNAGHQKQGGVHVTVSSSARSTNGSLSGGGGGANASGDITPHGTGAGVHTAAGGFGNTTGNIGGSIGVPPSGGVTPGHSSAAGGGGGGGSSSSSSNSHFFGNNSSIGANASGTLNSNISSSTGGGNSTTAACNTGTMGSVAAGAGTNTGAALGSAAAATAAGGGSSGAGAGNGATTSIAGTSIMPSGPRISDWCYSAPLDSLALPVVKTRELYENVRLLGRGSFGEVNLVKNLEDNKL
jgi:hypothetical protein